MSIFDLQPLKCCCNFCNPFQAVAILQLARRKRDEPSGGQETNPVRLSNPWSQILCFRAAFTLGPNFTRTPHKITRTPYGRLKGTVAFAIYSLYMGISGGIDWGDLKMKMVRDFWGLPCTIGKTIVDSPVALL